MYQAHQISDGSLMKAARAVVNNPRDQELISQFESIHTEWMKNLEALRLHVENTLDPGQFVKACG